LVGWLVGWLVDCLVGWLVGFMLFSSCSIIIWIYLFDRLHTLHFCLFHFSLPFSHSAEKYEAALKAVACARAIEADNFETHYNTIRLFAQGTRAMTLLLIGFEVTYSFNSIRFGCFFFST
jgi:hypothetical protein